MRDKDSSTRSGADSRLFRWDLVVFLIFIIVGIVGALIFWDPIDPPPGNKPGKPSGLSLTPLNPNPPSRITLSPADITPTLPSDNTATPRIVTQEPAIEFATQFPPVPFATSASTATPTLLPTELPTHVPIEDSRTSLIIDSFEGEEALARYWLNAPGNVLTPGIAQAPYIAHGDGSLALSFQISGDPPNDYVGLERDQVGMDWRNFDSICIWIYNQDQYTGHLVIQFRDADEELWKAEIQMRNISERNVCVDLVGGPFLLAGGPEHGNREMDLGWVMNYALYLGAGGRSSGTVYLDYLRLER